MYKRVSNKKFNTIFFKPDINITELINSLEVEEMTNNSGNFKTSWSE